MDSSSNLFFHSPFWAKRPVYVPILPMSPTGIYGGGSRESGALGVDARFHVKSAASSSSARGSKLATGSKSEFRFKTCIKVIYEQVDGVMAPVAIAILTPSYEQFIWSM